MAVKVHSKPRQEFTPDVKAILKRVDNKTGHTELRILSWLVDGHPKGQIRLEKRAFHHHQKDGETVVLTGKCMGLLKEDIEFILGNWADAKLFFEEGS